MSKVSKGLKKISKVRNMVNSWVEGLDQGIDQLKAGKTGIETEVQEKERQIAALQLEHADVILEIDRAKQFKRKLESLL